MGEFDIPFSISSLFLQLKVRGNLTEILHCVFALKITHFSNNNCLLQVLFNIISFNTGEYIK